MKSKLILILTILVLTLSSCKQEEETYKLGFIGTLSGEYAEVGLAQMNGAMFAVEEINKAGGINGREVVLEIRDDKADSSIAVAMQNELYDLGIDIIIGHSLSIVAIDVVANANEKDILLLSPSIGTNELSGKDDNLIRLVATVELESKFITTAIIEDQPEKVLFLYNLDNLVLTKYHRDAFVEAFTEANYTEDNYTTYGFESGNDSQEGRIEEYIDTGDYDTVFIASPDLDAAKIVNYITVNDLDIDVHLTSWASTGILTNIDLTKTDNIYGYINFDAFNDSAKFTNFKEDFFESFNENAAMLHVNGYDVIYMLKEAVENIDSFDNMKVKAEILRISTFEGVNSNYTINEYGDCLRDHLQLVIVDEEFVPNEEE